MDSTSIKIKQYNKKIKDNYKRNFVFNMFDGGFFSFGLGFISMTTVLPYFVHQLTESKVIISLIVSVYMLGSTIPQLFAANIAETLSRNKKAVIIIGFFQRIPFVLLAVFTFLLNDNNGLMLFIFFLCWAIFSVFMGTVTPFWFNLVSKIIPDEYRGRFFGYRSFWGSILGVSGAFFASRIIESYRFPINFTYIFSLTVFTMFISWAALFFMKETDYPVINKKQANRHYLKKLVSIIKNENNFRLYLLSILFTQFIGMVNGLFTVAGIERLGLDGQSAGSLVGIFSIILISNQSISSIVWGYVSDKWGHKTVLLYSAIFNLLGVSTAIMANNTILFYLVFICTGIALGGAGVSFLAIIPDFCDPQDTPSYVALVNLIRGFTTAFISIVGGMLADVFEFSIVFMLAASMIGIGIFLLKNKVVEPRVFN